ncbi:MAG: M48 family peptidase, partial [Bifidobacterium longum]|nr:M48 family peptidase [Bifidobacterium longum]MDU2403828.1 M48 family peptidase [Bifidobacterium longum]
MPYRRRQSTAPKSGAPKSVRSAAAGQSLDIDGIHLHLTRK